MRKRLPMIHTAAVAVGMVHQGSPGVRRHQCSLLSTIPRHSIACQLVASLPALALCRARHMIGNSPHRTPNSGLSACTRKREALCRPWRS